MRIVGSVDESKSTSGVAFFHGKFLVSFLSKKQCFISLSTIGVEYIVATTCFTQMLWMKQCFKDLQEHND